MTASTDTFRDLLTAATALQHRGIETELNANTQTLLFFAQDAHLRCELGNGGTRYELTFNGETTFTFSDLASLLEKIDELTAEYC